MLRGRVTTQRSPNSRLQHIITNVLSPRYISKPQISILPFPHTRPSTSKSYHYIRNIQWRLQTNLSLCRQVPKRQTGTLSGQTKKQPGIAEALIPHSSISCAPRLTLQFHPPPILRLVRRNPVSMNTQRRYDCRYRSKRMVLGGRRWYLGVGRGTM